jgi:hypothetical protein
VFQTWAEANRENVSCNAMRPLKFNISTKDGLNEYHLGATYDKWLEKTIWTDKKELYNTLCDNFENQESQWHKLFYNLAYYNCTHEENIFIYERLIWDLIQNRNVYVIINFRTASFLSYNDFPFDKVNWEYEIECQANLENTETIFSDNGFVKARSSWIKPPTPRWNNEDEDKTAVFKINDFATFIKVVFACIMDDCGSLNFFCIEQDKKEKLISTLQGTDKPILSDILECEDLFITLFLGADEGYQDYLLIKSKTDLTNKLNDIANNINKGGEIYETELESVNTFDQLTSLIDKSFGLKHYS